MSNENFRRQVNDAIDQISGAPSPSLHERVRSSLTTAPRATGPYWIAALAAAVIAVMLVLSELGIDLAPLLASAGIAGLAIGFGAQNLVKDFIAGMFMLLEDQYGVGDNVDLGQASGTVEAVGLRITTIRDVQGIVWYIRNGEIARVGNKSQGWARALVDLPLPLDVDVAAARELALEVARGYADEPAYRDKVLEPPRLLYPSVRGG